jgi:hypothetical protein
MNPGETSKSVTVTFLDGNTASVDVRRLPSSKLCEYIELIGKEAALIALLCVKPAGWADQLSDESIAALIDAGRTLNEARAIAWATRTLEQHRNLKPVSDRLSALGFSTFPPFKN